jgi:hypothetical protein
MPGINNIRKYCVSEKSKGVVVFASNTDQVDYLEIASKCARLIQHSLGLPVTLVTDDGLYQNSLFDKIIRIGKLDNSNTKYYNNETWVWRNKSRYRAYELSPYDTTILLDADYAVLTTNLNKLLDTEFDYLIMGDSYNPHEVLTQPMARGSIDFLWATVIVFKKTLVSQNLFDLVRRIEDRYSYYCAMFNIFNQNYRNDYAFAIADLIINGYTLKKNKRIPWSMFTFDSEIKDLEYFNDLLVIRTDNKAFLSPVQDIHIMDKMFLLSDNFSNFIEQHINNAT